MESSTGMSAGQDVISSPGLAPSSTQSAPAPSQDTANEKKFSQSELNGYIAKAKAEAVERDRRLRVEQPEYAQSKYANEAAPAQNSAPSAYQPSNNSNEASIRQIVADETQRQRDAWETQNRQRTETEQAQNIVNKFWNKISPGKEKYPDFDKVTGDIEFARFPNTVQLLAEHVDNSADILYELGKDRIKMANLETLSYLSPRDAIMQAQRIGQSIKDNEAAAKIRLPNEPLSQLRSTTGMDSGIVSHKDLRMKYRG